MKPHLASAATALVLAAALSAATAGTKLKESSKGTASYPPARKVLVVLVTRDAGPRAGWENVFAGELALRGTTAIASHELFPELPAEKDRDAARARVASEGFDAVVIAHMVGDEVKVKWNEGTVALQPEYMGQDWWGGYWYTYSQATIPGYLTNKSRVRIQIDFWRRVDGGAKAIWAGTSDSLDPLIDPQAGREIVVKVANALAKAGLI